MTYVINSREASNPEDSWVYARPCFCVSFYRHTIMQYHDQLHPWVVYRLLPNCQNSAIARFRRRNDASMYLAALQRQMPQARFVIAFDPPAHHETPSPDHEIEERAIAQCCQSNVKDAAGDL